MISEINGKLKFIDGISRSEDKLTGNFFGALRYLPYEKGLALIFKDIKYLNEKESNFYNDLFKSIDEDYIGEKIEFWNMTKDGELDLEIDLADIFIGVEVKYLSGLSGKNQLEREFSIVDKKRGRKPGLLLFVVKSSGIEEAIRSIEGISDNDLLEKIGFGYLRWESIFNILAESDLANYSPYEKRIMKDLLDFLSLRGFEKFKSFEIESNQDIDKELYFIFEYDHKLKIGYEFESVGENYYEFG